MSALLDIDSARHPRRDFAPQRRISAVGIGAMVGFHLLVGYTLVSGLATDIVQAVQKPLMASIVPEPVRPAPPPPPPPPPPPKIERVVERVVERVRPTAPPPPRAAYVPPPDVPAAAPTPSLAAVQNTTPAPAPAPPVQAPVQEEPLTQVPALPAPVKAMPARSDVGVACPGYQQLLIDSLTGAYDRVGIAGVVKVQFRVSGSQVSDFAILSGPRDYQRAVQKAVRLFKCQSAGSESTVVTLDIAFRPQ